MIRPVISHVGAGFTPARVPLHNRALSTTAFALALALFATSPAHAQSPDVHTVPNAFRDIANTGVELPFDDRDEGGTGVLLGFSFPFYGQSYTQVTVTTNGYLTFGNAVNPLNEPIPEAFVPNALVAPFWDDLDLRLSPDAKVYFERTGPPGQQTVTVQWQAVALKADPGSSLTFQAVLFESGEIQFHYADMLNSDGSTGTGLASGASATVGVESPDGQAGVQVAYNTPTTVSTNRPGLAFLTTPVLPQGQGLGDLDNDGAVDVVDQSRLAALGNPAYPPAPAAELVAADVAPPALDATSLWGDGRVDANDRDLLSQVIVRRETLGPYLSELAPRTAALGSILTLTGSRFSPTPTDNLVTLTATGGTRVTLPADTVDPQGTQLTVVLPLTARHGDVYVTTNNRRTNALPLTVSGIPTILAITPNPAVVGQSITITGLEFPPTQADTTVTIGGQPATVTATAQSPDNDTITATVPTLPAGTHDVRVSSPTATSEPFPLPLGDLPVAQITLPTPNAEVRDRLTVTGTASDPSDFLRYELAYAPLDGNFVTFHEGTVAVTDGALGTFDPTLLLNGYYRLRLTVTDSLGLVATDERVVSVQGDLKLGHFTLSFLDLELPASGVAIRVYRDYDSRDKQRRDFGLGWRQRLVTLDLEENFQHSVVVNNPITSRTEYSFTPEQINPLDPRFFTAGFTPTEAREFSALDFESPPGVDPGNKVLFKDSVGNFGWFPEAVPFDPEVYRIVQADGTVLRVADELAPQPGLLQILKPEGSSLTITRNGLIHSGGRSVLFERDALDRITRITDPRGSVLTYSYDNRGDLVEHADAEGFKQTFVYREDHHLLEWFDDRGVRVTRNEYDDAGRLIATIDPFGNRLEFDHDLDGRREIVRDRQGRPTITEYDTRGRATKIIGSDGLFETYVYSDADRMLQRLDRAGGLWIYDYDAAGNQTRFTDPAGNTIRYTYDARGNLLTVIDADGGLTTYTYNAQNLPTSSLDPAGGTTTSAYDADGNRTSHTDEAGETTLYEYNAEGDLIKETSPTGQVTLFAHDANGNVTSRTVIRDVPGKPAERATTNYAFDRNNNRTLVERPDGTSELKVYGGAGRIAEQSDSAGRKQTFIYNDGGQLAQRVHVDGRVEVREYDADGNLTAVADRRGRRSMELNARGQPTKITFADQTSIDLTYDALGYMTSRSDARGNVTVFERDGIGRVTKEIDPLTGATLFEHDGKGNVTKITDPDGGITEITYDGAGRPTRTVYPDGRVAIEERDTAGRVTRRTDPTGRVSEYVYGSASDEASIKIGDEFTRFERDAEGRVTSQTNLAGHTTRFRYDQQTGERIAVALPLGQEATFAWSEGHVTQHTDFDGRVTKFERDGLGKLLLRVLPDGTGERLTWSQDGRRLDAMEDVHGEILFAYDQQERLALRQEPDGRQIAYAYDEDGRVGSITTPQGTIAYGYDLVGRLASVTDTQGQTTSYTYTPGGKPLTIVRPNGVTTTFDVGPMGRLMSVTHTRAGTVIAGYTYTYNPEGHRASCTEAPSGRQTNYTYDGLGRLTQEAVTEGTATTTTAYAYDVTGNRTSRTLTHPDGSTATTTYIYDANDRLLRETVVDTQGGGSTSFVDYTYDASGNTLTRATATETTSFTHDGVGRVIRATVSTGSQTTQITYRYDHFGNRIQTIRDGVVTHHLVDTNRRYARVLADVDADGNPIRVFAHGEQPLSLTTPAGDTHYYLQDGQLSVRALADGTGALTASYDYDAYGVTLRTTGTIDNPLRYTGERFEPLTGLYFLRSRYLDPRLGRFITRDTFEGFREDPPTLHPYAYALNNPVNRIDPPGTFSHSLQVMFAFTLPNHMLQLQLTNAGAQPEQLRVRDLLGSLNTFLPSALDIFASDHHLAQAQAILASAIDTNARIRNIGKPPLSADASKTYLFGAKVYGRVGSDFSAPPSKPPALTANQRLQVDAHLYGRQGTQNTAAATRKTQLFKRIKSYLDGRSGLKDIRYFDLQRNAKQELVGWNMPDIQFTIESTKQRWAIMLASSRVPLVSQIDRIVRNDPRVIACEIRDDAEFSQFLQALRFDCNFGSPAPFIITLKPSVGTPEVVKDAIPQRNKRAPFMANSVIVGAGVMAHSGEFVLNRTDLHVPGRGIDWKFSRTYRSGLIFPNSTDPTGLRARFHLGHNWTMNYDERLGALGDAVLVLDPKGRMSDRHRVNLAKASKTEEPFDDPPSVFGTVVRTGVRYKRIVAGKEDSLTVEDVARIGFVRRSANGTISSFNPSGWLVAITDRNGNTLYIVRDQDNLLRLVIDTIQRRYIYRYKKLQGQDTLQEVEDVTGNRKIVFKYEDGDLNLTSVTSPAGRTEGYVYSKAKAPALAHNMTGVIFPEQMAGDKTPAITNTYQTTSPEQFDYDSVTTQTIGGKTTVKGIDGVSTAVSSGGTYLIQYEEQSALASISNVNDTAVVTTVKDPKGEATRYELNRGGNPLAITDATGATTLATYNKDGLAIRRQTPNGQVTFFGYELGTFIQARRANLLYSVTFPAVRNGVFLPGIVREYDYDPIFGQLRRTTETQGFEPVTGAPLPGQDPRTFLKPSDTYENYTQRVYFDYQEGQKPQLPRLLIINFQFDFDALLNARKGRWAVPFGLGDLNGDGYIGPAQQPPRYSGAGFRGLAVRQVGRKVRLDHDSQEFARLGQYQIAQAVMQHNEHGQITAVMDAEGNTTKILYYDGSEYAAGAQPGYVKQVTKDATPFFTVPASSVAPALARSAAAAPARTTTEYTYDPKGNTRTITDPNGTIYTRDWDKDNLLIGEVRASNPDSAATLKYVAKYEYNQNRMLVSDKLQDKVGEKINPKDFERKIVYDLLNDVIQEGTRLDTPSGETWLITRHEYDSRQQRKKTTHPQGGGNSIIFDYDERRLVKSITRAPGVLDSAGRKSTIRYSRDPNGNVTETTSPDGDVLRIQYDAFDRPESITSAHGRVETRSYDEDGHLIFRRLAGHPGGPTPRGGDTSQNVTLSRIAYVRDDLHRVKALQEDTFTSLSSTAPVTTVTSSVEYDRLNRRVVTIEPDGQKSTTTFDGLSRVVEQRDAIGNRLLLSYDPNSNLIQRTEIHKSALLPDETYVTGYVYDRLNRVTAIFDGEGQQTRFAYDSRDKLILKQDAEGPLEGQTNGPGNVTRYRYDTAGRPIETAYELRSNGRGDGLLLETVYVRLEFDKNSRVAAIVDDNGNRTEFGYDDLDRRVSQVNADGGRWAWSYRADNTMEYVTDPNGTRSQHTYDTADRLVRLDVLSTATNVGGTQTDVGGTTRQDFEYDGLGRLTKCVDNAGHADPSQHSTVTRKWDSRSRLIAETQNGASIENTWDSDSNRLTCNYPGGRLISWEYDSIDRPVKLTDTIATQTIVTFDWAGPGLRELRRVCGDGTVSTRYSGNTSFYDKVQRPTRIRCHLPGGDVFLDREYSYNRVNLRTAEIRHEDGDLIDRYLYDSLYRVLQTDLDQGGQPGATRRPVSRLSYVLDGVGNRLTDSTRSSAGVESSRAYSTNEVNEYASVAGILRRHSENGNLLENERFSFQYDFKNRLVAIRDKSSGTLVARYRYDALNRRTRREVLSGPLAGTIVSYKYDGQRVIEERGSADTPTLTQVYGPTSLDSVVQLRRADATATPFYLHQDARNSVVAITQSAAVVERRYYDDYGRAYDANKQPVTYDANKQPLTASAVGNRFGFQGRRIDPETGLYFFRARFYDPKTGRFLQRDPVWDPFNFGNAYSFVGNSPISRMDPTGEAVETAWDAASLSIGLVSLGINIKRGKWREAALDAFGVTVDAIALAVPFIPGGMGAAIKAYRAGDRASDLFWAGQRLDRAIDGLQTLDQASGTGQAIGNAYAQHLKGNTGWSAFNASLAGLGGFGSLYKGALLARAVCFLEGTLVETKTGKKPIEDLRIGDLVLSRDEATGVQDYKPVARLFRGQTDRVLYLRIVKIPSNQRGRSERHEVGSPGGDDQEEDPDLGPGSEQTIRSTIGHRYYVDGRGWVPARNLKVGDRLHGSLGEAVLVVGVRIAKESARHFNIEVEGWHTYFVGELPDGAAVWVHNHNCKPVSTFKDRVDQTPAGQFGTTKEARARGEWSGERGRSTFTPARTNANRQINRLLKEYGETGVSYKDGMVNFRPFSEGTVNTSKMTTDRTEIHGYADELLAAQWNRNREAGRTDWEAADVFAFRKKYKLSWHEWNNMKTMELVPTEINAFFGHLGGIGELKLLGY